MIITITKLYQLLVEKTVLVLFATILLSSCYSTRMTIGEGADSGITIKEKNHFIIYGLVPLKTAEPEKMAKGDKNYDIEVYHSFVDGLLGYLTFGIYTPTTTIVTK